MIRIALPNKGRLSEATRELLERAGLEFESRSERALQARLGDDFLALFVRSTDIPEFVADGAADLGITGRDLMLESGRPLVELLNLGFGRCRLVLAVPDESHLRTGEQIAAGTPVATSFPNLTRGYFAEMGTEVTIVPVSGAAEIAPHIGVAEVITDLVSTGSTLKTNGLREVATLVESTALLVGRRDEPDEDLLAATDDLVGALESVIRAQDKRYLMANVPRDRLPRVRDVLPGLSGPTVIDILNGGDMVATHAVIDRREVYRTIADLKALGATGILVTKIERLSP
jgi:ATP phosphoribosyltransferase